MLLGAAVLAAAVPVSASISGMSAITAPLPSNSLGVVQAELNSVSCVKTNWCIAVGHYESTRYTESLILTKNAVWGAPRPGVLPSDAAVQSNAVFNFVKCVSINNCVAVGQYNSKTGYAGFIDTDRNGVWGSPRRTPLPGDAAAGQASTLESVSCLTLTTCVAVGQYANAQGNQPLIAYESAGVWNRALRAPMPPTAKVKFTNQLSSVSCTSWGTCVAVGQFTNVSPAQKPLVDIEAGGAWHAILAPHLPGDAHRDPWSWLLGVDCVAAGNCTAVGVYQGTQTGQGLIVSERNGIWGTGQRAAEPSGYSQWTHEVQLLAIDCTSVGNCVASGQFTQGQNQRGVVIEEIRGGWGNTTIAPHPTDATTPFYEALGGISCVGSHCSMVGQYQATLGQPAEIVTK